MLVILGVPFSSRGGGGDSYGETRTTLTVAAHSRVNLNLNLNLNFIDNNMYIITKLLAPATTEISLTGSWVGRCIFLAGNNLNESYGGSINPYFVLRT